MDMQTDAVKNSVDEKSQRRSSLVSADFIPNPKKENANSKPKPKSTLKAAAEATKPKR
jgi:hypothetical protein